MMTYLARRLLALVPLLLVMSFIVFVLIRAVPGDIARAYLGDKASREVREDFKKQFHLDKPLLHQYALYMDRAVLHGDFGTSPFHHGATIMKVIGERLPATIELTMIAMILAILGGLALGILSAVYKNSAYDYMGMTVALMGVSVPVYWLGLLLLMAFGGWFAGGGRMNPEFSLQAITGLYLVDTLLRGEWTMFLDVMRHILLPAMALATIPMAMIARITRSSMLEVMSSDYIRTARAKGLPSESVILKHALRNALIPIVTLTGLEFGYLLGGAVLTETVFGWPGMGTLIMDSVSNRDYYTIQGAILVLATIFVIVNLLVDVLYAFIDPRIRYAT